jgi:hypothetical protein
MPKTPDLSELAVTKDELRELRLALALRITRLKKVELHKLPPSQRAKVQKHIDLCSDLHDAVTKALEK